MSRIDHIHDALDDLRRFVLEEKRPAFSQQQQNAIIDHVNLGMNAVHNNDLERAMFFFGMAHAFAISARAITASQETWLERTAFGH